VVWRSEVTGAAGAQGELAPGTVVADTTCATLFTGSDAFVFGAVLPGTTRVAEHEVLTTLPSEPTADSLVLEPWRVDARIDPGATAHYGEPIAGNPTSFAEKFAQMRQRTHPIPLIEKHIRGLRERLVVDPPDHDDDSAS
jgi:hypothetical protein